MLATETLHSLIQKITLDSQVNNFVTWGITSVLGLTLAGLLWVLKRFFKALKVARAKQKLMPSEELRKLRHQAFADVNRLGGAFLMLFGLLVVLFIDLAFMSFERTAKAHIMGWFIFVSVGNIYLLGVAQLGPNKDREKFDQFGFLLIAVLLAVFSLLFGVIFGLILYVWRPFN